MTYVTQIVYKIACKRQYLRQTYGKFQICPTKHAQILALAKVLNVRQISNLSYQCVT